MALQALYLNFKNDFGDLLGRDTTDFSAILSQSLDSHIFTSSLLELEDPPTIIANSDVVVMFLFGARISQFVFLFMPRGSVRD